MLEGRWRDSLPGRNRIAEELGCSHWTAEQAVRRLANEGLLVHEGAGRRRRIVLPEVPDRMRALRVMILMYEDRDRKSGYLSELLHRLRQEGHDAAFAARSMKEMHMDVRKIARFVGSNQADAWVIVAGPHGVLRWFAEQGTPAFALFGRQGDVDLPSSMVRKSGALIKLVDRLVDLGHRRIVMLAREERRKPNPGFIEQRFLDRLGEHSILTGTYNLPDWQDGPAEFRRILGSLFAHTPPTALIIDEPSLFIAAMQHLASLGIVAPRDVSLACTDSDPVFDWCHPEITRIIWDPRPITDSVVKWVNRTSRGERDRRKTSSKAKLVLGGTIGAVPD